MLGFSKDKGFSGGKEPHLRGDEHAVEGAAVVGHDDAGLIGDVLLSFRLAATENTHQEVAHRTGDELNKSRIRQLYISDIAQ